ncbi:hypothetical protein HOLleu_23023 [Holothuria leucospilota]|uniref:MYND-type domain-containing protein n=1 Tax=Holothuria leucospilota TaxID=206669 RepID=A0A9Q1BUQ9_HOLLE|nr:hypothetical protein HOLleu_23023 [Holothuria leucospilota]
MDVKPGLCWRCESRLQSKKEACFLCKIDVYCSTKCSERDEARHGSVECKMWSRINKCEACGRIGRMKECSGCYAAWFCDKTCQGFAWKSHKVECSKWTEKAREVALAKKILRLKDTPGAADVIDYPYYFGNNIAFDLLRLPKEPDVFFEKGEENALKQDFSLLLAGCGDLRNAIHTIYCLPQAYVGKLRFLLNDVDPFVMARNVLLLYMMASHIDSVSIATIWLSTRVPEKCFNHLRDSLDALIASDSKKLKESTNGSVSVDDATLSVLTQVWKGWKKLRCRIGSAGCINLDEQRRAVFASDLGFAFGVSSYRQEVDGKYLASIDKWLKDGIIISPNQHERKLFYFNPTLTGRPYTVVPNVEVRSPKDWEFQYCVKTDCLPFSSWDFLDLVKDEQSSSVTTLLHLFVSKCVQKTIAFLRSERVTSEISIDNFVRLPLKVPKRKWNFDRIFTSNLADYYGMDFLLKTLGPLLNPSNHHATLFVGYMNWAPHVPGAMGCERDHSDQLTEDSRILSAMKDLGVPSIESIQNRGDCYSQEYNYNVPHFISYLRGEQLAVSDSFQSWKGGSGKPPAVPSWPKVTSNHGLRMRDFRKQPNKIVPFFTRINARVVTLQRGFDRFLEWYRPTNDDNDVTTNMK